MINNFSHIKIIKFWILKKIYEKLRETHLVYFEPELSPGMIIKHENRMYPTILLFCTGSYTFLGGKMENVKYTNKFIREIISNYTVHT